MDEPVHLVVVGAGAAGLMAAIHAGRVMPDARILVLDGARTLGAKILVAGGGRCNVTHDHVDETAFSGSSPAAIRKVLRQFDASRTVAFFRELGVELKREETGKLFPVTDRARTVLDALLRASRDAGVIVRFPWRVERVGADGDRFVVEGSGGRIETPRLILATGGRSLPKSGSDGHGYELARTLGHTITRVFPALVPLVVREAHFVRQLSGLSTEVVVEIRSSSNRKLVELRGSLLCTHFGISGPVVLDASRHLLEARSEDPDARMVVCWLPGQTFESADRMLVETDRVSVGRRLREMLPERLVRALCEQTGVDQSVSSRQLPREKRRELARTLTGTVVPVVGDRGFTHAEVTAGGVPLRELDLSTMTSRVRPGLQLIGEICDVDGRIGGYNFQWAWASGHVAGRKGRRERD